MGTQVSRQSGFDLPCGRNFAPLDCERSAWRTIQRELRKFSQRIGAREPPNSGLDGASPELRTALWNVLYKPAFPEGEEHRQRALAHARAMWNHLGWRTDQIPLLPHQMRETIAV